MSSNMCRLLFITLLMYVVLTESCIIPDKKGISDIRVIEIDDSKESGEPEIVALHLPDRRKREVNQAKQERSSFCKNDEDCGPGSVCIAYLTCVKGTWRTLSPPETTPAK